MTFVRIDLAMRGVLRIYLIAILSGSFDNPASFKLIAHATLTPISIACIAASPVDLPR